MRYELKDYQHAAVNRTAELLREIRAERTVQASIDRTYLSQVSLSAATGAGKTVMVAALLERLLTRGSEHPEDYDPTATVIWFSDDPALNEQSRIRVEKASDRLTSRTVTLDTGSLPSKLECGKVYFLNAQKLAVSSRLVQGGAGEDPDEVRPDQVQSNFYDTLRDTLTDPDRQVYLVLDEAHRGIADRSAADKRRKDTIVRRLIGGQGTVPPIETVIGVSATPARFDEAMRGFTGRVGTKPVIVDPASVQASGLLKDTIALSYPEEAGNFDTLLVSEGTAWLKRMIAAWDAYTTEQGIDPVVPLMVIQLPDKASPEFIGQVMDAVRRELDVPTAAFAHVLGEHGDLDAGTYTVRYIEPRRVAEDTSVRVLLAKTAISTGWDCPRAEVLVSLRPGSDDLTHITQLLGRMVRTPLARRVEGEPVLGTVYCLLPRFDGAAVQRVASMLTRSARRRRAAQAVPEQVGVAGTAAVTTEQAAVLQGPQATEEPTPSQPQVGDRVDAPHGVDAGDRADEIVDDPEPELALEDHLLDEHDDPYLYDDELEDGSGGGGGREMVINPIPLARNSHIERIDEVVVALERLESARVPRGVRNPASRLFGLVGDLAADKVSPGIIAETRKAVYAAAKGLVAQHEEAFAAALHDVGHYSGATRSYDLSSGHEGVAEAVELTADRGAISDSFRIAQSTLGTSYAIALHDACYAEGVGGQDDLAEDEIEDLEVAAEMWVAALSRVAEIAAGLEDTASALADRYFGQFSRIVLHGSDAQRTRYMRYESATGLGEPQALVIPSTDQVPGRPAQGRDYTEAETYSSHVLADEQGVYYSTKLNTLEQRVLAHEQAQPGFVAWYRNGTGGPGSLGLPYAMAHRTRLVFPDLLIVGTQGDELVVDLVDPHRVDLPDALPKLLGLADYAENKPAGVRTVIAVSSEIDGKVYTLDLGTEAARAAVRGASDATAPYLEVGVVLAE